MRYAKFINRQQISYPPLVKGNISNYHLSVKQLKEDGYKLLDDSEAKPTDGSYLAYYEDQGDKIIRFWKRQELPEPTYYEKRAAEYPPIEEYLDAQVKINSGDEALITAGQEQLAAYYEACLDVKARYPKPAGEEMDDKNET